MSKPSILGLSLVLSALIVTGCGLVTPEPAESPVGLANPASVFCEERGYRLEIRTDADGGQYGVCIFPDGSECEEWAYYRGECEPGEQEEDGEATPESCDLPPRLNVAGTGIIMPGEPNALRSAPGRGDDSAVIGSLPAGTVFAVQEGPVCADGYNWWRVVAGDATGWTAEGADGTYWIETFYVPVEPAEEPVVDGWVGTIVKLPPGSQVDDYFERDDGQRYGVAGYGDDLRQQVGEYSWTGAQVQVWGQLLTAIPDMENRQIQVERIEAVSGPATESRNLSYFATTSSSSYLPSDRWGTYRDFSAIDSLLSTPWCEGAEGPGVGEWIMLTLPGVIEVHAIGVDVGYDRDPDDTFRDESFFVYNNRLKQATVVFSSGEQVELSFADERGVQLIPLARAPGPPIETTFVKVVIDDVHPGTEYDDTCLAEIEVWGRTK